VLAQRARLERLQPLHGVHAVPRDRLRLVFGELFDVHATFGRRDDHGRLRAAVHHHGEVHLARDIAAGFDVERLHHAALGAGLVRDERLAEQVLGDLPGVVGRTHELHAAGLAAAARVDLRLHDGERHVQRGERLLNLVGGVAGNALGDGHTELRQELLGLVLVDVHGFEGRTG
jgi:hypothetical protein